MRNHRSRDAGSVGSVGHWGPEISGDFFKVFVLCFEGEKGGHDYLQLELGLSLAFMLFALECVVPFPLSKVVPFLTSTTGCQMPTDLRDHLQLFVEPFFLRLLFPTKVLV